MILKFQNYFRGTVYSRWNTIPVVFKKQGIRLEARSAHLVSDWLHISSDTMATAGVGGAKEVSIKKTLLAKC